MNHVIWKQVFRSIAAIAYLFVSLQVHAAAIDKVTIYTGSATPGHTLVFEESQLSLPSVVYLPAFLDPNTSVADFPIPQRPTFADNCDAVTKINEITTYIEAACDTAAIFSGFSRGCEIRVSQIVTNITTLLGQLGVPGPGACPEPIPSLLLPLPQARLSGPSCDECNTALTNIDLRLIELRFFAAACQQIQKNVADLFVLIKAQLLAPNPFPVELFACEWQIALNYATEASELVAVAQSLLPIIDSHKPECTLAELQADCDDCGSLSSSFIALQFFYDQIIGNGNVQEVDGGTTLDPIMDIIAEAMDAERDPDVADRLFKLLRRVARAQRFDSVRHIIYGTDQPAGQVFIAVRKEPATEDDACFDDPAVVIISALGRDAQLPEANIIDGERLAEGLRTFAHTLIPAPRPRLRDRDDDQR